LKLTQVFLSLIHIAAFMVLKLTTNGSADYSAFITVCWA